MASSFVCCIKLVAAALALLLFVLILRTFLITNPMKLLKPCKTDDIDFIPLDQEALDRFRAGLRIQTISVSRGNYNVTELDRLVQFIISSYPTVHSSEAVSWERVANYSLLYHVKGLNPDLKPYLLMAHLDVVPANAQEWSQPPFDADIHDGFIYARGTIDDKHSVFGILEALEFFLKTKKPLQRSFYVAFGHDEEVTGQDGAKAIAEKLKTAGVELEYILDEGLVVTDQILSFIDSYIAFIGVSEKGYVTLKLSANVTGGHSSMPSSDSSIGILANAVIRLEENPVPSVFGTGPEVGLFEHIAPEVSFPIQIILKNLWLFGPIVSRILSMFPFMNAIIRTTTAVTMFNAGVKDNVLPSYAEVIVNHRIHPSQSVKEIIEYDRRIINDDRIHIEVVYASNPHPVSDFGPNNFGYQTIRSTINQIWGQNGIIIAPGLMVGGTDTTHYLNLSKNVYRFGPAVMRKEDFKRYHGVDERISLKNYEQVPNFYYHLIVNSDAKSLELSNHWKASHSDF